MARFQNGLDPDSESFYSCLMTNRQFYDWQTAGGANDVMRLVDALERADLSWCVIGGVAVNHWAAEPMVTRDLDLVVAAADIERAGAILREAGFHSESHDWSINFTGQSSVSIQLSTEACYRDFPSRAVAADVHGILMRVASLQDTLEGKVRAFSDATRRQSKRIKDWADIVRLVEVHPTLRSALPDSLQSQLEP